MTWILVMGPTKWVPGHRPALPETLTELLPRSWVRRGLDGLWPIDVRAILVGLLRREGQDAVLMEEDPRQGREPHLRHFARLVRTHLDGRFFVYWPLKANLHGLDWELSHLGTRIDDEILSAEQVHVFPEKGIAELDADSDMVIFREEGGRTYYDGDLHLWGCRFHSWADYESLIGQVVAWGRAEPPDVR